MLEYYPVIGQIGANRAYENVRFEDVIRMLESMPHDAVINISDIHACLGALALRQMATDALDVTFLIDYGIVTYPGGVRVRVYADARLITLIVNLLDKADQTSDASPYTVAEILAESRYIR